MDTMLMDLCLNLTQCSQEIEYGNITTLPPPVHLNISTRFSHLQDEIRGKTLRIATLQNFPLNYAEQQQDGSWIGKGIAFTFVNFLQQKYKFQYTVIVPQDNQLGTDTTGIIGLLNNGEADLAAAFLPVLTFARQYVTYSANLDVGRWVVLLKRPEQSASNTGLLAPFTLSVWLLTLLSLIAVGPIMYLFVVLRAKLIKNDPTNKVFSLPSCFWFVYGALLKQGSVINPLSDSSRIMFATWWIFITILTAFYTANLTAFLTLSKFTLPIDKPSDIVTKKYHWVAQRGLAIQEVTTNPLEELNYFDINYGMFLSDSDEIILNDWVLQKNYMYIRDRPGVDYVMYKDYQKKARQGIQEKDRCTYVITPWALLIRPRAFAYAKTFNWTSLFNPVLRSMVESGIVEHLVRTDLPDTEICPMDLKESGQKLRNRDLFTTYMVVVAGFFVSTVAFIGEVIYRHRNNITSCFSKRNQDKETEKVPPLPPPPYHTIFHSSYVNSSGWKKQIINGRDYWVTRPGNRDRRLIPVRTPSALLFQYTN